MAGNKWLDITDGQHVSTVTKIHSCDLLSAFFKAQVYSITTFTHLSY